MSARPLPADATWAQVRSYAESVADMPLDVTLFEVAWSLFEAGVAAGRAEKEPR